jgi:hypothetical protein
VYYYRLNDNNNLEDVAQDLKRYLKTLTIKKGEILDRGNIVIEGVS